MADRTAIEWTDATWNPVRGCARVSDGCRHCYAERVAARFCGAGQPYQGLIHPKTRGWNGKVALVPEALQIPWRWTRPRRIFVNSMSDLFHPDVPFEFIAAVFWVMSVTTRHSYQILTKRPERAHQFFRWVADGSGVFPDDRIGDVAHEHPAIKALRWEAATAGRGGYDNCGPSWPYVNVWLGVSVEDQATADERIPHLLRCPAAVRWISAEPLLGPIDLMEAGAIAPPDAPFLTPRAMLCSDALCRREGPHYPREFGCRWGIEPIGGRVRGLDWVVVGGESGPGARPMHPDWARSLRDQCAAAEKPFLFKQWGDWTPTEAQPGGDLGADMRCDRVRIVTPDDRADGHFRRGDVLMAKVGKKVAGRLLDGVMHNAYPEAPSD